MDFRLKHIIVQLFLLLSVGFAPVQARAQDISIHLAEIPDGLILVYERSNGSLFSKKFVGQTPDGYQVEWYVGDMQGSPTRIAFLDSQGNTLRYTSMSGKSRVYTPHYCNRTLGTCRLELVDQYGNRNSMTVTTRATLDGFSQAQVTPGEIDFSHRITLGIYGIRTFELKDDGRTIRLLRSYLVGYTS